MERTATISDCTKYRYHLGRKWGNGGKLALFVMLNPSTADASVDDSTIRRCIGFAQRLDCDGFVAVNLFAYRATKPKDLAKFDQRSFRREATVGPENDAHILKWAAECSPIILAWGSCSGLSEVTVRSRRRNVLDLLRPWDTHSLGTTAAGEPRHPLFLSKNAELKLYRRAEVRHDGFRN